MSGISYEYRNNHFSCTTHHIVSVGRFQLDGNVFVVCVCFVSVWWSQSLLFSCGGRKRVMCSETIRKRECGDFIGNVVTMSCCWFDIT